MATTKAAAVPAPLPDPPVVPSVWTPATVVAYVGAFALFVIGVLTMFGVTVPSGVSDEVQVWSGALTSLAGALTPLFVMLSKHSVAKTAIRASAVTGSSLTRSDLEAVILAADRI